MARPGDRLDIWVVERSLGTGGMGSVYRCHNADAPRILAAVKVLEQSLRTSDDAMRRFVREAEILYRLDHPNIVRVRNVRTDHEPPFIEMEFVEGDSLEQLIEGRALPLRQAFDYMAQLVDALEYMHAQNVRHRDIKPANLLVTEDGRIKLVDFGLAVETDLARITAAGMAFGTVYYAPPEWIDPAKIDPVQWDLYAAGVVFYEMITGKPGFATAPGGTPRQQAMHVIMQKQGAPPLDLGEPYPEELRGLIRGLTAPTPAERPQSATEVREWLERARRVLDRRGWDLAVGPRPSEIATQVPAVRRTWSSSSRASAAPSRVLLGSALAAGAAVGLGLAWGGLAPLQQPPARDVLVQIAEVPPDYPVSVRLHGQSPVLRDAGGWLFERVPVGTHGLSWAAGQGCAVDACERGICPEWCGSGVEAVAVEEGSGPLQVELPMAFPRPGVVVSLPALQEVKTGLFKRKPQYKVTATLDGQLGGIIAEHTAAWRSVVPGRRELVVSVGECSPEALGCWPDRRCPEGCVSTIQDLVVPWGDDDVQLSLRLPAPK